MVTPDEQVWHSHQGPALLIINFEAAVHSTAFTSPRDTAAATELCREVRNCHESKDILSGMKATFAAQVSY